MGKEKKKKSQEEKISDELVVVDQSEEAKQYFLVSLSSGYEFRNLIDVLLSFSNSANFCFTKEGFKYKYFPADKQFLVEVNFPSEILNNYVFYSSNGEPINIGLSMEHFYNHVKSIRVKDMIRLFLNPDDKIKRLYIQTFMEEGCDINKAIYIQSKYVEIPKFDFPDITQKPDRVISYLEFEKMGTTFKPIPSPYIFITKKEYPIETTISFELDIENKSSGGSCLYQNPSIFSPDTEPTKESVVRIPKSIMDKFSSGAKSEGIVRIFVEHKKYVLFEISYTYICYVRILIHHEKKKKKAFDTKNTWKT